MKTVGVYEAKNHLARLLDEVEAGETITITRHGKPVARIVPADERRRPIAEIIEEMREFRRAYPLDSATILELVEEGRRY
jgi:prevent-host-death family protein